MALMSLRNPSVLAIALLLVTILAAPVVVVNVEAGSPVHPGDFMSTSVGGCTVSFVFDGVGALAGRTYMSTAAHCVNSVGSSVNIGNTPGFATVAYIHSGSSQSDDFAFLEVDPQHVHRVQASVRGHPGMPTAVAEPAQTSLGDLVLISGHGLGFSIYYLTRESRVGVLYSHFDARYVIEAPIIFGDSGGPLLHQDGGALGIVSAIVVGCCQPPIAYNEGPTVQGMVSKAAGNGFSVQLRTA